MNKEKTLVEVTEVWSRIRQVLMKLGYKGDHIAYKKEKILEGDHLDIALAWLINFEKNQIGAYNKAYNLVPESVWAAHLAFKNTGTHEQKMLAQAKRDIIAIWKTRPSILRRDNVVDARTKNASTGKGFTGLKVHDNQKNQRSK